jgi:beta-xylosidase
VHLQPVKWVDDWPLMGTGVATGAVKGEPVLVHRKPTVGPSLVDGPGTAVPATSDDFNSPHLGLQWQWQANPGQDWFSLVAKPGALRLFAQPEPAPGNLYDAPNLLMQKFPALAFNVTATLDSTSAAQAGLIVFGYDYAWIGVRDGRLVQVTVMKASEKSSANETAAGDKLTGPVRLRVEVTDGAKCRFSYSLDGKIFTPLGEPFTANVGRWVGAKVGLFAAGATGSADYDAFEVTAPAR